MKYTIVILLVTLNIYASNGLLRDRVVQRNCKQQLETLLAAIGVQSVEEALNKVQGLPQLCDQLGVSSIVQIHNTLKAQGTQEQIAQLLKTTQSSTLEQVITKTNGLSAFLNAFGSGSVAQAHDKVNPMLQEVPVLRKRVKELEKQLQEVPALRQRVKDLEKQYADLVNQCKKVEKEFSKIGVSVVQKV